MRYFLSLVLCMSFLFLVVQTVPSEEVEKCGKCNGTGKLVDKKKPDPCPYKCKCTFCFNDYPSHGFGFVVCPKCYGAQVEFDEMVREYETWLKERRNKIDKIIWGTKWQNEELDHIEGLNYAISGRLRKCKVREKKKYVTKTPSERAHLILTRCEHTYKTYILPAVGDPKYIPSDKWEISIWKKMDDLLLAGNRLVGITQPCASTYQAKLLTIPDEGKDEDLHQALTFLIALLFIEEYKGFVDGGLPDWYWEAFAHYAEYAEFKNVVNNCNDEAAGTEGLNGKNFRIKIKMMVKRKRFPKLEDFGDKNVALLTPDDRLIAWSLVDWMISSYGAKKLALFTKIVKRTKNQGSAFRDAIGFGYTEVMDEWEKWVKENY